MQAKYYVQCQCHACDRTWGGKGKQPGKLNTAQLVIFAADLYILQTMSSTVQHTYVTAPEHRCNVLSQLKQ